MKMKLMAFVILTTVVTIVFVSYGAKDAAPQPAPSKIEGANKCLKIGVVSVRKIFQDCRRNVKYRQDMTAERDKIEAELEKLSREIDLDKAGLKTLKAGSPDYLASVKEILEKQGKLQAQQEYFKRQMEMREQSVVEQLFKDVVKATEEVAKDKGFDLVLERSEPDLPAVNSNELTLTISTYKVLFNAGCEDITDAVLAKVDSADKSAEK